MSTQPAEAEQPTNRIGHYQENLGPTNYSSNMEEDDDSKIFPQRLMEILSDEANSDCICFLPNGRAFVVKDRKLFEERIMPRYFSRKAKFSSFTRKLNRWNFVRVSSGPEAGAYYHEFFLRDKPHLVAQMFCKNARSKMAMAEGTPAESAKDTTVSRPAQPHAEPAQQAYTLDIPLALLEALVKPAPAERQVLPSNVSAAVQPGLLLQQSQYANLLLERQIQILQQEQAKRMIQMLSQDSKPPATSDDQRLRQMQLIMQNNQRTKGSPTNPRASAA